MISGSARTRQPSWRSIHAQRGRVSGAAHSLVASAPAKVRADIVRPTATPLVVPPLSQPAIRPRRYSTAPYPAYRYVPGENPHPVRDPRGHSHDVEAQVVSIDASRWAECEAYLIAADLFNARYYWEAHEALEGLWRAAPPDGELAALLQGVIQLAAALLKSGMGEAGGASRLAARGCDKLRAVKSVSLGFDCEQLAEDVERYLDGRDASVPLIWLGELEREQGGPNQPG